MDREWIINHHQALINKPDTGCKAMFELDKRDDLRRLYQLFLRVPETLKGIHKLMTDCIKDAGKQILNDPEKAKEPVHFIEAVLGITTYIEIAFFVK